MDAAGCISNRGGEPGIVSMIGTDTHKVRQHQVCPVCGELADGGEGYCRAHAPLTEEMHLSAALETLQKLCDPASLITAFIRGRPRISVAKTA